MARFRQSLEVTDRYRARLATLAEQAQRTSVASWAATVDQDRITATSAVWLAAAARLLEAYQRAGVRLTAAYVAAYLTSELGVRSEIPSLAEDDFVGTVDGSRLAKALDNPRIQALVMIRDGAEAQEALTSASHSVRRLAATAVMGAPRAALADQIAQHPQIVGWRRVTSGGCGACLAAADGTTQPDRRPMLIHDHCHCTAEPVIADVPDHARRPTGREIFDGMTPEQQDEHLGPTAAELIRTGRAPFHKLIGHSPMEATADQITQALVSALEQ